MLTFRSVAALLFIHTIVSTGLSETHRFEPTEFYNTFSGAHKAVLRIKPGDHVITSTIDAGGTDAAGVRRGQGPNPETGPFYIEGAESGDTLVVHLLRLETNRTTGFSASLLAPYTADPGFLRQTVVRAGGELSSTVMVGDAGPDIGVARRAGTPVIGVSFGYTEVPIADLKPDRLIHHMSELRRAVAELTD